MVRPEIRNVVVDPDGARKPVIRRDGLPLTEFKCLSAGSYTASYGFMTSESGMRKWHNCTNYKRNVIRHPGNWNLCYAYSSHYTYNDIDSKTIYVPQFGSYDNPTNGLPVVWDSTKNDVIIVSESDANGLIDASLDAMLPGIRPRLSILNSIYELRDMRTLPRSLARVREVIGTFRRAISSSTNHRRYLNDRRSSARAIARAASDLFLQWNFNLRPLVSDVCGVYTSLRRVRGEISHLLANEGRVQRRHYRCGLPGSWVNEYGSWITPTMQDSYYPLNTMWYNGNPAPTTKIPFVASGPHSFRRDVTYRTAQFNATMEYSYTLPSWAKDQATLRGYLDSLGINVNPAIIWNAIPWSFVVDWVFGVSRWLDQFKLRNIQPTTTIHRYCWSVDVERTVNTTLRNKGCTTHQVLSREVPMYQVTESAYKRRVQVPDIYSSLTRSGISSREFMLSAALLGSR